MSNKAARMAGTGEVRGTGAVEELRAILETSHTLPPDERDKEQEDSQQCLVSFPHLLSTPALSQHVPGGAGRSQAFLAEGTTECQGLKHPEKDWWPGQRNRAGTSKHWLTLSQWAAGPPRRAGARSGQRSATMRLRAESIPNTSLAAPSVGPRILVPPALWVVAGSSSNAV